MDFCAALALTPKMMAKDLILAALKTLLITSASGPRAETAPAQTKAAEPVSVHVYFRYLSPAPLKMEKIAFPLSSVAFAKRGVSLVKEEARTTLSS